MGEPSTAQPGGPSGRGSLLPFHRVLLQELLGGNPDEYGAGSGLLVMGQGLGIAAVAAALARLHLPEGPEGGPGPPPADPGAGQLALIVGATDVQQRCIAAELAAQGHAGPPIVEVTNELPLAERLRLYQGRSALYITSRILTVDLLTQRLHPRKVAGFIVLQPERASGNSGEAFAVRLFREGNPDGFVRALMDEPQRVGQGFHKVERVMKAMLVRRLLLWPRFEAQVRDCLEAAPPEVVNVEVEVTGSLHAIQGAIADAMEACLKELKKHNRNLDGCELTVEHGLFKCFGEIVRRQLDPVWHTIGRKSKQLVHDLNTLRKLSGFVLELDAVSFLQHLETLRASEGASSVWIFLDAAHVIFSEAKKRVYRVKGRGAQHSAGSSDPMQVEPVLEELPKWKVLRDILDEVQALRMEVPEGELPAPFRTLVLARDKAACLQLHEYLRVGGPQVMLTLYEKFLAWKRGKRTGKGGGGGGGRGGNKRKRSERNRVVGGAGTVSSREAAALADKAALKKVEELAQAAARREGAPAAAGAGVLEGTHFYPMELKELPAVLGAVLPTVVIVHDPHPGAVRELEVFKAAHPLLVQRIYFMSYSGSLEEHRFRAAADRERKAFQDLIREKAILNVPVDTVGRRVIEPANRSAPVPLLTLAGHAAGNSVTRAGGAGRGTPAPERVLIVDTREFMSTLPAVLHQQGFTLKPCTLEVGDYVLAPEICVERKAIPDLVQSLASGRLHNQATAMCKHYEVPVLLIEFAGEKAFNLQASSEFRGDISIHATSSKLVLLALHFPRLRIVWSRSQHATAEIFRDLKLNHGQPDQAKAMALGAAGEDRSRAADGCDQPLNQPAIDILRKLPGVTAANYRALMREAGSLAGLARLPLERLEAAMGSAKAAAVLHQFLAGDLPAAHQA